MNISQITSLTKKIFDDRPVLSLVVALVLVSIAYCVYVLTSVDSSSAQVVVRYTGFGSTHYYRDNWTYLWSFAGFGILIAILNTFIASKLIALEKRSLAIAWLIGSIGLVVVAALLAHAVVGIKYL